MIDYKLVVKISELTVCFMTENMEILNYIKREFPYYLEEEIREYDLIVEISNEKFSLSKGYYCLDDNLYIFENNIFQCIKAKGNHVWIKYGINEVITNHIVIYIPYKITNSYIERLTHPAFMPKWQCCLVNFLHGPFLGIIEMYLISNEETFLHAASFCANEEGIAIVGNGQTGKSTFVKLLSENKTIDIISEDFCIISNNEIITYPKQCRLYINQLSDTMYYKGKKFFELVFDKLNSFVFTPFRILGIRPLRRLSFMEIFHNSNISRKAILDKIIYVERNSTVFNKRKCSEEEFVSNCISTMMTEFRNLAGFFDLLKAYDTIVMNNEGKSIEYLSMGLSNCLKKIYGISTCYIAEIPLYKDLETTKKSLYRIINTIGQE